MSAVLPVALGGFADLYSEPDFKARNKQRALAIDIASVVARYGCSTCGAQAGEPCQRRTVRGVLPRSRPHFGRSDARRSRPHYSGVAKDQGVQG